MPDEPTLQRGHANHEWVEYAQKMLNHARAGGMHIDIAENGVFDEDFEREVLGFQAQHGVDEGGHIGPHTWAALHSAVNAKHAAAEKKDAEEDAQLKEPHHATHGKDEDVMHQRSDEHGGTVREYVMPDLEARTDTHAGSKTIERDRNKIEGDMREKALRRTADRIPLINTALDEFKTTSGQSIVGFVQMATRFKETAHVHPPWALLETAVTLGLGLGFAAAVENEVARKIFEKVSEYTIHGLTGMMETASNVDDLEKKLEGGALALVSHVGPAYARAVDAVKEEMGDYIRQVLSGLNDTEITDDPDWIEATVEWLGFPEPTYDTVGYPLQWSLDEQFAVMLRETEKEFLDNA